jgi:hypothetical protein
MTTAAHPTGSGWEHLSAPSADFIDSAPEEPLAPRSRIRRRFQAMLVQMLGDETDIPPSPEPAVGRSPRSYESKHRRIR